MQKIIKKKIFIKKLFTNPLLGIFFVIFFSMFFVKSFAFGEDILEQLFKPSIRSDSVINLGNDKNAVGNEIFREGTDITFGDGDGNTERSDLKVTVTKKPPLIVRFAKTLLRFTVALAITMLLFSGIKYIIETTKGGDSNETIKNITYIAIGLLLALGSLAIVNLVSSITMSSLDIQDNNSSLSSVGTGCLINNDFYTEGDELKKIACIEGKNGTWDNSGITEKCNYNGNWIDINTGEQKILCEGNLNGLYKSKIGIGCIINSDINGADGKQILVGEKLQIKICNDLFHGEWKKKLLSKDMFCKTKKDKININLDLIYKSCKNGFGGEIIGE